MCKEDLQIYFATRIAPEDGRVSSSIPCWTPNCNAILRHHDIQQHANIQDFEAYDDAPPPTGNLRQRVVRRMLH
jgi:hypothetical protein